MNAHEHTLGSISFLYDPSLDKYRVPFTRASLIHHPFPSHDNFFHRSGFVQDLRISGMGCRGFSSGMKRLAVEVTVILFVPSVIVTVAYFEVLMSRGGV